MAQQSTSIQVTVSPDVGDQAPQFDLPAIQGQTISLEQYRQKKAVVLWFSRGFTCNFCRGYMSNLIGGYDQLLEADIDVIQIAPNLHSTAQNYFPHGSPPFPFVCDPDKRLFAVYGLGDSGALVATRNTIVSFATAFGNGTGVETVRASWLDVANRNFVRRLHHHAMSAMEQGIFIIDKQGVVRFRMVLGALAQIPTVTELLEIREALSL